MIADQALARLAACHRAGVVHRDVKPDNLLLGHPSRGAGANRALHLVDFGLAALGPGVADDCSPKRSEDPRASRTNASETREKTKRETVLRGTPAFSAAAADAGRPPTYADDLEALVFTVAYLRAGTFPWCPPSARGDFEAVAAHKAGAVAEDLATDEADQEWMGALLARARAVPFGATFDLAACRGIVRRAFARVSGGARMRDTPFDWEQAGIVAVTTEMK